MRIISVLTHCISTLFHLCFFFNDTATTEIYTLSLHDALPISGGCCGPERSRPASARSRARVCRPRSGPSCRRPGARWTDRKSTRLNSSHTVISYAVFCLKKKIHLETVWLGTNLALHRFTARDS